MPGTTAIAGHRTTYGAPFRKINKVKRGDEIVVEMPYGSFTYEVEKTRIVEPTALEVIKRVATTGSSCRPATRSTAPPSASSSSPASSPPRRAAPRGSERAARFVEQRAPARREPVADLRAYCR